MAMSQPTFFQYSTNKDLTIAIQCLKHITEKDFKSDSISKEIKPALLRVIMDLQKYQECSN